MRKHFVLLGILTGLFYYCGNAQKRNPPLVIKDSAIIKADSNKLSAQDTGYSSRMQKIESYIYLSKQALLYINHDIDTSEITEELPNLEDIVIKTKESNLGLGNRQSLRNLNASKLILTELKKQLEDWEKSVAKSTKKIDYFHRELNKVYADSSLLELPKDSLLKVEFRERLIQLSKKFVPAVTSVENNLVAMELLQNRIVKLRLDLQDEIGNVSTGINNYLSNYWKKEQPYIWDQAADTNHFWKIWDYSVQKGGLVLTYFFNSSLRFRIFNIFLFFLLVFSSYYGIKQLTQGPSANLLTAIPRISKYPFFCSVLMIVVAAQYMYSAMPMIYVELLWLIMGISGTIIFWRELYPVRYYWLIIAILFCIVAIANLLLWGGRVEQLIIIGIACIGVILGWFAKKRLQPVLSDFKFARLVLWLLMVQSLLSMLLITFGRYTLGKVLCFGAYFNIVTAVCIYWWVEVAEEYVMLQVYAYRDNKRVGAYINFNAIEKRISKILQILGIIGWLLILVRNLNFYNYAIEGIQNLLVKDRQIGSFHFTFGNIAIFFLIIWLSNLVVSIISILLDTSSLEVAGSKKNKLASSIILIKILIYSMGFLLAIGAAGIPLDKITIILSALGVGIGFGLQNIVSNLISGIILAFEKPIHVGDLIEVDGKAGRVKEIGLRSSKLLTGDGSEVIIPNADLITRQLINWTGTNNSRKFTMMIRIRNAADIPRAEEIIDNILADQSEIMKSPRPAILVSNIRKFSTELTVAFWVTDMNIGNELKSNITELFHQKMEAAGIEPA